MLLLGGGLGCGPGDYPSSGSAPLSERARPVFPGEQLGFRARASHLLPSGELIASPELSPDRDGGAVADIAVPLPDLAAPVDLSPEADLKMVADIAVPLPDLAAPVDLSPGLGSDSAYPDNSCIETGCAAACNNTNTPCMSDSACGKGSCNFSTHKCTTCISRGTNRCYNRCVGGTCSIYTPGQW